MTATKHFSTTLRGALPVLGVLCALGCNSSSTAGESDSGTAGADLGGTAGADLGGTAGAGLGGTAGAGLFTGHAGGEGVLLGAGFGGTAGAGLDGTAGAGLGGTAGAGLGGTAGAGLGGTAGAGLGGAGGTKGTLCEIELQKFENNGYRTCAASDIAEVTGDCGPEFDYEYGATETCGTFRIHAYGHDGRIGCAYDSATGDLVGGFLYGIPVPGMSCGSYFAGPAELATCPVPTTPFCRSLPDAGSAEGGAAGAGGASDGGAAGAL